MKKYKSIEISEYLAKPDITAEEWEQGLACPLFRICNLYKIQDKNGNTIPFIPNEPQRVVLYYTFILKRKRIAIPKARQLGFSTLIAIIALDLSLWGAGSQQCSIVDQTRLDAESKLAKVNFAFEHLDPSLKNGVEFDTERKSEIIFGHGGSVAAGKNARGGTNNLLHISEWGVIDYEDPARSIEILTGAIPSASGDESIIFAESTYKGGKGGHWYQVIKSGLEVSEEERTERDWTVLFFEWFLEPSYRLSGNPNRIKKEDNEYFDALETELGITLDNEQRLWYVVTKEQQGRFMLREYPSKISEMWSVRDEGQIYAQMIDKARQDGRINDNIRWYEQLPVYAVFDIGATENTKCSIFQLVADRILYLEAKSGGDDILTPHDWVKWLTEKRYRYGCIFLPHDGETMWLPTFKQLGMRNSVCLKKPKTIWDNVILAQTQFERCEFHKSGVEIDKDGDDVGLVGSLEAYHCKKEKDGQTVREIPVHDWSSHFATCFGYSHQAMADGLLVDRSAIPERQGLVRGQKPRVSMGRRSR